MKNSLFKRVVAAAAAVPLALTQSPAMINAVSTDAVKDTVKVQAEDKSGLTLEDILYIPATETVSKWNKNVVAKLSSVGVKSGDIDINDYAADIISHAGQYADIAEYALSLVSDVKYELNANLDFVVTGKIAEPDFNEVIKNEMDSSAKTPEKTPGRAMAPVQIPEGFDMSIIPEGVDIEDLKNIDISSIDKEVRQELADKYNIPELASDDVKTIGDITSIKEKTLDNETIKNIAQDYVAIELSDIDFTETEEEDSKTQVGGEFKLTIYGSDLNSGTEIGADFEYKCNDGNTYYLGQLPKFFNDSLKAIKDTGDKGIQNKFQKSLADALQKKYDDKIDKFISATGRLDTWVTKLLGSAKREKTYANVTEMISRVNEWLSDNYDKEIPATATDIAANKYVNKYYDKAVEKFSGKINITTSQLATFADSLMNIKCSTEGAKGTAIATFPDSEQEIKELTEELAKNGYVLVSSYKKLTGTLDLTGIKTKDFGSVNFQLERVLVTDTTTTGTSSSTTTTTTTTTAPPLVTTSIVKSYVDADTDYAFYLNTEDEFDKTQVASAKLHTIYVEGYTAADGKKELTREDEKIEDVTAKVGFGTATPANTYKADNADFKYEIPVLIDGKGVKDNVGQPVTIDVYIGVKGDTNLDGIADSVDASQVLRYYAELSVEGQTPDKVILTGNKKATNGLHIYDEFAAFLSDVQFNADKPVTRLSRKTDRLIDAVDSSRILAFYTRRSSSDYESKSNKEIWAEVDNLGVKAAQIDTKD